ncbi:uncharacterized protein LOC110026258 [Phalaenopsis equestris]|uniref:uncharacterized protein LOC110026258 n=1 Tax=Phalaenopsis equestris TaxID=78828 RepID=UPI0009E3DF47|nr:uncharacterized protein LOC110026258 [Phalaenopsis equestris]
MKKLYNGKGKRIHPSPPPSSPWDFLAALPAALLSLAAALSPEEKEVLVYLLSDTASGKKKPHLLPHQPELRCGCFSCYKSFWARWNASPNHHLIHQILDAVEETLQSQSIPSSRPSRRRRRGGRRKDSGEEISSSASFVAVEATNPGDVDGDDEGYDGNAGEGEEEDEEEFDGIGEAAGDGGDDRSPVRRLVSFIGERVWGVWNY